MSLKEILGEELFNQVSEKLGDKKIDIINNGNWIPLDKFNSLNETKKDLETQLNAANTAISDLKKGNKDNEELQGKIKQYETDLETLKADSETKIKNLTLDNAIKLALKDNKAKFEDLLIGKVDREKLNIKEDGSIEGLDEQINGLKETYKDLFVEKLGGTTPNNTGSSSTDGLDQITKTIQDNLGF